MRYRALELARLPPDQIVGMILSVAAIEARFWANLCRALGLDGLAGRQHVEGAEREHVFERPRAVLRQRSRDGWMAYLEDKNTCVGPVLTLHEPEILGDAWQRGWSAACRGPAHRHGVERPGL